jgi:pterin-4a-carbinolamine dehydratase
LNIKLKESSHFWDKDEDHDKRHQHLDIKLGNTLPISFEIELGAGKGEIDLTDLQVKEFNKRALGLSADVVILGMSKDLPFAQQRFCALNNIKNINVLSDYKTSSFGLNYGLLIKELNLLARATVIIDVDDVIRYFQVVPEVTDAPNYEDVLKNLSEIIKPSSSPACPMIPSECIPCESGTPPLAKDEVERLLKQVAEWQLVEDKKLVREFKFKDFVEAKYFLDLLAIIAEEQGHHPNFTLIYNKLKVTLTTHASGGLTENDFIMARIINDVGV